VHRYRQTYIKREFNKLNECGREYSNLECTKLPTPFLATFYKTSPFRFHFTRFVQRTHGNQRCGKSAHLCIVDLLTIHKPTPGGTALLKKLIVALLIKKFSTFTEPEGLLPGSHKPTATSYPNSVQSS